jgi:hypothetical protein
MEETEDEVASAEKDSDNNENNYGSPQLINLFNCHLVLSRPTPSCPLKHLVHVHVAGRDCADILRHLADNRLKHVLGSLEIGITTEEVGEKGIDSMEVSFKFLFYNILILFLIEGKIDKLANEFFHPTSKGLPFHNIFSTSEVE